jgi:hypothetical protein
LISIPPAVSKIPAQHDGVIPDPKDPKKQLWIFRRGDVYIRKGDQSVKVETPHDLYHAAGGPDLGPEAARDLIEDYVGRLSGAFRREARPILPVENPNQMCGERLLQAMATATKALILGPSGSGKSEHLKQFCTHASKDGEVPVFIRAGRYTGGDLIPVIAQAIAPFSAAGPELFLKAAFISGRRIVLVTDGLNECQARAGEMLSEITGFMLRNSSRLIVASQTADLVEGDDYERILVAPLTFPQKRFIYCYHAKIEPTARVGHLCDGFSNGYDLALAGRCHDDSAVGFTRVEL